VEGIPQSELLFTTNFQLKTIDRFKDLTMMVFNDWALKFKYSTLTFYWEVCTRPKPLRSKWDLFNHCAFVFIST